jgi:hypothetical protein
MVVSAIVMESDSEHPKLARYQITLRPENLDNNIICTCPNAKFKCGE